VEWSTIRLLFTLSVAHNLPTTQIDFKNAFVQSSLPKPIYMSMPPGGYNKQYPGKIMRVKKSLYGDRRAPRLWYLHLRAAMEKRGFKVSLLDPCLFIRKDCIFVAYVDDGIFVSHNQQVADSVIKSLEDDGFDLTREGDLAAYLGVKIEYQDDGSMNLSQPALIQRIISALGLEEANGCKTPAERAIGRELDSPPATRSFNYRSLIGMLLYLGNNTRPDLCFAIHQCARHCINPRLTHEQAIKRIGRYLKHTAEKGLVIKPKDTLKLDCYVDADFAGLWGFEDGKDPSSARSRTGFVITMGSSPVMWASKMQTEIALSTMESEYIALSTAMRSLIPLRILHKQITEAMQLPMELTSTISTVFEDNRAAEILATKTPPRLTPRSKHIAVKYHWFREQLSNELQIKAISTDNQKADIFTKALPRVKFEKARQLIMGW
jgi:histone deacetylase 1/2